MRRSFVALRKLVVGLSLAFVPTVMHATKPETGTISGTARGEVGPPGAPVTMIAFTDFQCPFSSRLFFTLRSLEEKYPGKVHVILKQTPLDIHPDAPLAHRAAIAAGLQGRYNEMAELLYANQNRIDAAAIDGYAAQLHLDVRRFRRDVESAPVAAAVNADMEEGRGFGITVTPTLYVDGRIFTGVQTESSLSDEIGKAILNAPALARARQPDTEQAEAIGPKLLAEIQSTPAPSQGVTSAPLTIVEFTDFQCPYCRAAVSPMEQLMQQRGQQVRWVFRSFPLDFHQDSELANEAALAAGEQGKFWPMHDLLFANQGALKPGNLRDYAQRLGLNMPQFDAALQTHKFAAAIAADRVLGQRVGVTGTPAFVIDGKLVDGVRSLPELLQIADAHRNAAESGAAATEVAAKITSAAAVQTGRSVAGTEDAPLTLTWYCDVRSPLAARQAALVQSLIGRYGEKLRVVYNAFPLAVRSDAQLGAAALIAAAAQERFWPMFHLLASRRDTLDRAAVLQAAATLQFQQGAFAAALDAAATEVQADSADAARRGILGAPVMFLNKQRVDGLQREEFYVAIADRELKEAPVRQAGLQTGIPPASVGRTGHLQ